MLVRDAELRRRQPIGPAVIFKFDFCQFSCEHIDKLDNLSNLVNWFFDKLSNFFVMPESRLKTMRERAGFTRAKDFAVALGVSASYVSELESGKAPLTDTIVKKLSEVLKLNSDFVIEALGVRESVLREASAPFRAAATDKPADLRAIRIRAVQLKMRLVLDWMESREFPESMQSECAHEMIGLANEYAALVETASVVGQDKTASIAAPPGKLGFHASQLLSQFKACTVCHEVVLKKGNGQR